MKSRHIITRFLLCSFVCSILSIGAANSFDVNQQLVLHFPERASLGQLYWSAPGNAVDTLCTWHAVGKAQGAVRVPKGADLMLQVGYAAAGDPSLLTSCGPNTFTSLQFGNLEINDKTIEKISELSGLRVLNLTQADISDQSMKPLGKLNNLEVLDLSWTLITGRGWSSLGPMQSLKNLTLDRTNIDDNGLMSLRQFKNLRHLSIVQCPFTDRGLNALSGVSMLDHVDMSRNQRITAKGLMQLIPLRHLMTLRIQNTQVTALDLGTIKDLSQQMPSLRTIVLRDKSFTPTVVKAWQQALPHVKIQADQRNSGPLNNAAYDLFRPSH